MSRKAVIITSGDPAGCGPTITLKAIEEYREEKYDFLVVGDKVIFENLSFYKKVKNKFNLINLNTPGINKVKTGYPSKLTGAAALSYFNKALDVIKNKKIKRLVTAPLSKEAVKLNVKSFSGHTEYLAQQFKISNFVMLMTSSELRVALITRHIRLKEVSAALEKKGILSLLNLTHGSLKKQFKIKKPKIVFASFNPHAGVNTFLEKEEKTILEAIDMSKVKVSGPYPADTLFTKESIRKYDCIICTYHDQAMIPFKMLSLRSGVNATLGLPIIRTSPAHGTAFDLMRQGKQPFHSSMSEAIKLALKLS